MESAAGVAAPSNMALQRTRRPSLCSGRSLRSLGSPLNAQPLGISCRRALASTRSVGPFVLGPAGEPSWSRNTDA
jgi:hypothetical protein